MKAIILASLFLAGIATQAAAALPQGLWKVEQVTIEKSTNGNVETTVYNAAAEVQSYIPCFKTWEIGAQNIVIRYDENRVKTVRPTVKGNTVTIVSGTSTTSYQYELSGDTLTLTVTHNYPYNHRANQASPVEEKWTIKLKEVKN